MRRNYFKALAFILGAGTLVLFSCHGNNSNTLPPVAGADTAKTKAVETADQDSETYLLPSPLQIASIFKNSGLTYIPNLTATIKDASQYNAQYEQALNMGVYSADLSYCILNKQTDDAGKYLKIVKSLSDKLGFGSVFESNSFMKRFDANMSNTDSLAALIADLQMETDTYLENNKQKYVGIIAFAGAWAESMHIGSNVYIKHKTDGISSRISEQMNILGNLIKLLNKYKAADSHISNIVSQLKTVQDTYAGYQEVKNYNEDSDQPIVLTPEHINELSALVEKVRTQFLGA